MIDLTQAELDEFTSELQAFCQERKVAMFPQINFNHNGITPVIVVKHTTDTPPAQSTDVTGEVYTPPTDAEEAINAIIEENASQGLDTKIDELI